jgi:hypothetical protein
MLPIPFVDFIWYMVSTGIVMFMFGYLSGLDKY